MIPPIHFRSDLQSQAEYICFLAKTITENFYQSYGYLVLPYPVKQNPQTVYFPDLPYSQNFWQLINQTQPGNLGTPYPDDCIKEINRHLTDQNFNPETLKEPQIISQWEKIQSQFFRLGTQFLNFQNIFPQIHSINITITNIGTPGSFYPLKTNNGFQINLTYRIDFPIGKLIRTLLLCFYNTQHHSPWPASYYHKTAIMDYLFRDTAFQQLFPEYDQIYKRHLDRKQAGQLLTDSQTYLTKLGFVTQPTFQLDSHQNIILNGNIINSKFTYQEQQVLKIFIRHRPQPVTYDQLAEAIWHEHVEQKFSLYSIAKIIQNLRAKFRYLGINQPLISTVRGQGYIIQ